MAPDILGLGAFRGLTRSYSFTAAFTLPSHRREAGVVIRISNMGRMMGATAAAKTGTAHVPAINDHFNEADAHLGPNRQWLTVFIMAGTMNAVRTQAVTIITASPSAIQVPTNNHHSILDFQSPWKLSLLTLTHKLPSRRGLERYSFPRRMADFERKSAILRAPPPLPLRHHVVAQRPRSDFDTPFCSTL